MSMSVGASGYSTAWQQNGHRYGNRPPPPSAEKLASQLFSTLDTGSKGYLSETDLETAFSNVAQSVSSSQSGAATSTSQADNLMSALDTNGDGKVSQDELTAALKQAFGGHHRGHFAMRMAAQGDMQGMGPSAGDQDGDQDQHGPTQTSGNGNSAGNLMQELMALVKTYGQQSAASDGSAVDSLLSVTA